MKALPSADTARGELLAIPGNVPELINPPQMCRFFSRCAFATDKCKNQDPELEKVTNSHSVACFADIAEISGK